MKPELTKHQREDLQALARRLLTVPNKKFKMQWWVLDPKGEMVSENSHITPDECGYAGCAIGWGMAMKRFECFIGQPLELGYHLGFKNRTSEGFSEAGTALFGGWRKGAKPKQVAGDIRRYLKDGTLPYRG